VVPQPNPLPKQGHPEQAAQDLELKGFGEPGAGLWLLVAVSGGRWDRQWTHSVSTRLGAGRGLMLAGGAQDLGLGRRRHRGGGSQAAKPLCLSSPTRGAPTARDGATAPLPRPASRLASAPAQPLVSPSGVCGRAAADPCLNASSALPVLRCRGSQT